MNKSPTHDLKTCKCSAPHSVPSQLCPVRVTPPSSFMQFTAGYISPIFACDYKEVEPTRAPRPPFLLLQVICSYWKLTGLWGLLWSAHCCLVAHQNDPTHICVMLRDARGLHCARVCTLNYHLSSSPSGQQRGRRHV